MQNISTLLKLSVYFDTINKEGHTVIIVFKEVSFWGRLFIYLKKGKESIMATKFIFVDRRRCLSFR